MMSLFRGFLNQTSWFPSTFCTSLRQVLHQTQASSLKSFSKLALIVFTTYVDLQLLQG